MKLMNTTTIEALENQAAALLEVKHELTKTVNIAEAEVKKMQALVDILGNAPDLYTNEEADKIYFDHAEAINHRDAVEAKLDEVISMMEKLEHLTNEMKEFNEYWGEWA